jgi:enoyl-CoA hydratase/carnithine racemase
MSLIDYTLDESVAIITMNNGENRFNPDFLDAFLDVLDKVENETEAKTVIVTSAHEKIFTNGLDLEWLVPVIQKGDDKIAKDFFFKLNKLFKRVVNYPMITIAAISGHSFAGGAIFTGAFDFRFMRSDRGFFCIPEVDLGIPFLPGMLALLGKAIPEYKFNEMQYTGMRLTAKDCEEHHIVLKALHIDDLMKETLEFAKGLNKNRSTVKEMKKRMNRHIIHALDVEDVPYIESGKFNI